MDRLFVHTPSTEDRMLASLARAEEGAHRARRLRRRLVGAVALASVVCFAVTRFSVGRSRWSALLFAGLALSSLAAWYRERRLSRRLEALFEQLPVEYRLTIGAIE